MNVNGSRMRRNTIPDNNTTSENRVINARTEVDKLSRPSSTRSS